MWLDSGACCHSCGKRLITKHEESFPLFIYFVPFHHKISLVESEEAM